MSFNDILIILLLIILCILFVLKINYKKQEICILGGNNKNDILSFLKENYSNAYSDSWKVSLIFLNIRYYFNDYVSRMKQKRKYFYNDVLGKSSLYGYKYNESTSDIINLKLPSRKFEAFFYQKCGQSKELKYFPFGTFDKNMFRNTVYDIPNAILDGWEKDKLEELSKKENLDKIRKDNKEEYDKTVDKCLDNIQKIINSKITPHYDKNGKYHIDSDNKFMFSDLIVEWDNDFPINFSKKYYPNFNLVTKHTDIHKVLAIITMNHMPVFTNNRFNKNLFKIERSPGLMTSSIPTANKKIRNLKWIKDNVRKSVPFYNEGDGKGPPNFMIETYASPLNRNAEVFCSLFPSDRYISGCIGKFDYNLDKRLEKYNWKPKVIFVNPPYTFDAITNGNKITDMLHSKYPLISITTLSRRDGGLLSPILISYPEKPIESFNSKESKDLMEPMFDSPYLKDFIIVPEELFEYEDLFTNTKMMTASRTGALPTDSIILIKTSMKGNGSASKLKDIQKIIYDEIPKTQSNKYFIKKNQEDNIIKEIKERSNILKINITDDLIKSIIKSFNRAVS